MGLEMAQQLRMLVVLIEDMVGHTHDNSQSPINPISGDPMPLSPQAPGTHCTRCLYDKTLIYIKISKVNLVWDRSTGL